MGKWFHILDTVGMNDRQKLHVLRSHQHETEPGLAAETPETILISKSLLEAKD